LPVAGTGAEADRNCQEIARTAGEKWGNLGNFDLAGMYNLTGGVANRAEKLSERECSGRAGDPNI